jgi:hypothetical protein
MVRAHQNLILVGLSVNPVYFLTRVAFRNAEMILSITCDPVRIYSLIRLTLRVGSLFYDAFSVTNSVGELMRAVAIKHYFTRNPKLTYSDRTSRSSG